MSIRKQPIPFLSATKVVETAVAPTRKLKLAKETLKDLAPPTTSGHQVRGGAKTVLCTLTQSPS